MPGFTFNPKSRSFAGPDGKTVLHTAIRAALDSALDTATTKARADGDAFAAGTINAPEYATRIHAALKSAVTMAVATAAGGWQQTTALDWSQAARFTKARYAEFESLLTKYHRDEATGPQLATWAAQLIQGGRSAYEAIRRRLDLAAGMTRERRVLGDVATVHCAECEDQAAMGWQDAGVLLPIGSCTCLDNCKCEFEREGQEAEAEPEPEPVAVAAEPKPVPKPEPKPVPKVAAKPKPTPTAWPAGTNPKLPEAVVHTRYIRAEHDPAVANLAEEVGMTPDAYRAALKAKLSEAATHGEAYIRVDSGTLPTILDSGRFKNQFETNTTRGSLDFEGRRKAEAALMGVKPDAPGTARPVYGYLSTPGFRSAHLEASAETYGDAVVRLKPGAKDRATLTVGDSLSFHDMLRASPVASPSEDSFKLGSPAFARASKDILEARGDALVDTLTRRSGYVELQYFGGVRAEDIAEVGLIGPPGPRLRAQLEAKGIPWRIIQTSD